MIKRPMFICSAIEHCKETANCCPHKQAHIKDERCVPRECRYAPGVDNIDCVPYDPETPRVPVPVPPAPVKTVEQTMREISPEATTDPEFSAGKLFTAGGKDSELLLVKNQEPTKDQDIKEAVKKAAQRPVKTATKGKKKAE